MTSPIVSTSNRPSSGSASGQISSPPPKKRPFATTTSNIAAGAPLAVDGHLDLGRLPAGEDGEGRPQVGGLPAERLRRLVRALRDRAAHPGARDVREGRRRVRAVPGAVRGAPEVDRADVALQGDLHRVVDLPRDPEGAREVPSGPARDDGDLRLPPEPGETVRDLVDEPSPPTTTRSSAPSSAASRASSARCPCRSLKSVAPSSPAAAARRASSGQRRPVEPFAEAGLTRKTVCEGCATVDRGAATRRSRRAARARSSGRRPRASPRR